MKRIRITFWSCLAGVLLTGAAGGLEVRVKDVSRLSNSEMYNLVGYGLVVGLAGTGDSDEELSQRTIRNMLETFNIAVSADNLKAGNVAAVMITALIDRPVHPGDMVSATVSSIGDASSLTGGELLLTPVLGEDGETWATGQGAVYVGGFSVGGTGEGGDSLTKNHPTSGVLINGLKMNRSVGVESMNRDILRFIIDQPDFTTAENMAEAMNRKFPDTALAMNAAAVQVRVPVEHRAENRVNGFISELEQLTFEPDQVAKVVINERTGTLVFGGNVRISAVAVSHGNLSVSIKNTEFVSQPIAPFSRNSLATTEKITDQVTQVEEQERRVQLVPDITTVGELVNTLNALGATPRDTMAILHALKRAGSLHARLQSI
jgi:flagellar P-ring protein precursor FlgI